MKKFLAAILALALLPALASCSGKKMPEIGIVQLVEHPALSDARLGFIAALKDGGYVDGENVKLNIQISSGETSNLATIADQFVGNKVDLILAIATPACQSVAGKTTTIPILGTAVTDYVLAGLIDDNNRPGRNVSGTSDMNPVTDQIDLIFQFAPDAKTIGFIYNSSEDNSKVQVDIAKTYIETLGLSWKEVTVSSSNDVQQAAQSLVSDVDAIYLPTDNIIAQTIPSIYGVTAASKTPVICGEVGMVDNGGLATLGITYYNLGYETGQMAIDILKNGKKPADMPIGYSKNFEYAVNKNVAAEIGVTIPDDLLQYAK